MTKGQEDKPSRFKAVMAKIGVFVWSLLKIIAYGTLNGLLKVLEVGGVIVLIIVMLIVLFCPILFPILDLMLGQKETNMWQLFVANLGAFAICGSVLFVLGFEKNVPFTIKTMKGVFINDKKPTVKQDNPVDNPANTDSLRPSAEDDNVFKSDDLG